jgi:hypothetical protein
MARAVGPVRTRGGGNQFSLPVVLDSPTPRPRGVDYEDEEYRMRCLAQHGGVSACGNAP